MRTSILAVAIAVAAGSGTPASAAIVYTQSGTVDAGNVTFEVPRVDLAPGTYQVNVRWDQPGLAFFPPFEMGVGFSYDWFCGTPAVNCGGQNGVSTLSFTFAPMSAQSNQFLVRAGYSVPDPGFPIQPATLVVQPEWFNGGTVELSGFDGPTPLTNYVFEINAVPEPATWAMMILGFSLAGAAVRKHGARARGCALTSRRIRRLSLRLRSRNA